MPSRSVPAIAALTVATACSIFAISDDVTSRPASCAKSGRRSDVSVAWTMLSASLRASPPGFGEPVRGLPVAPLLDVGTQLLGADGEDPLGVDRNPSLDAGHPRRH